MPDPDPTRPVPGPADSTPPRTRKKKRKRVRIQERTYEERRRRFVTKLLNPNIWLWGLYVIIGLLLTLFLLSRSIGRAPTPAG